MTSALRRFTYLIRFAVRDLFEVTSLRTTVAAVLTIAAVVGFSVVAFGLALGARAVRYELLREDPVNRCLWYGDPVTPRMTDLFVAGLRQAIASSLPPTSLECLHPFSRTADDWEW